MVRSCVPFLSQFSHLFTSTSHAPLSRPSPANQQSCDLISIPYSSWRPSTCPQKCKGTCPHLPLGRDVRANGQSVAAPVKQTVQLLSEEEVQRRNDAEHAPAVNGNLEKAGVSEPRPNTPEVPALRKDAKDGNKADGVGASGSGAGLSIVTVDEVSKDKVNGKVTPDLTSLFSDDDDDDAGLASAHAQNSEVVTTQRSSDTRQLTADWLDKLADSNMDDDAVVVGLDHVDLDHDGTQNTGPKDDDRLQRLSVPISNRTTRAPPFPALDSEKEEHVELGASPNVVKDAAQSLVASIDSTDNGKDNGTLGHVYFHKGYV